MTSILIGMFIVFNNSSFITALCASAASCFSVQACAASEAPITSCFAQYIQNLNDCNEQFNHNDPSNPNDDVYVNGPAWEQCRAAANDSRDACEEHSDHANLLRGLWTELINSLKACIDTFGPDSDNPHANPENLQECVQEALDQYRDRIADIPDSPNACQSDLIPRGAYGDMYVGTMDALRLAAISAGQADGRYKTKVNRTVGITAGIGISAGNEYNVSQIACAKSAIALEIYQTKNGTEIIAVDADLDPSDGIHFDMLFFGSKLKDATDVAVLAVYFDEHGYPLFGEMGEFVIEDSPISGDWNRDEVLNTQDVIDFLDSYDAQTKRADLNNDDQVNTEDAQQFSETVND